MREVITGVACLLENLQIEIDQFGVLESVVILFLDRGIAGPVSRLGNQSRQDRTSGQAGSENDDVGFHLGTDPEDNYGPRVAYCAACASRRWNIPVKEVQARFKSNSRVALVSGSQKAPGPM